MRTKKFQGENSKSAAAKARKADAKAVADTHKKQELEDALWQENDKHVLRKEQRKDDREKRRVEALERKKENQKLLDQESAWLRGKPARDVPAGGRVTRAQIEEVLRPEQQQQQQQQTRTERKREEPLNHLSLPLEENINRNVPDEGSVEARSIEDAIAVLGAGPEELDRHPERRMKAAYAAYEEANMPHVKTENPGMRLAQHKNMLRKEWLKSPDNPLNQGFANYNAK